MPLLHWDERGTSAHGGSGGAWSPAQLRMAVRRARRAKRLGYQRLTDVPHMNLAAAIVLLAGAIAVAATTYNARHTPPPSPLDVATVRQALAGVPGRTEAAGYQLSLPRTDLSVRVEGVPVQPELALETRVLFSGSDQRAVADGDLVVTEAEAPGVFRMLAQTAFDVTGLNRHPPAAVPPIVQVHIHKEGDAAALAREMRSVLAGTGTPLTTVDEQPVTPHPMFDRVRHALAHEVRAIGGVLHVTSGRADGVSTDVRVQPADNETVLAAAEFVVPERLVSTLSSILTEAGATLTGLSRLPAAGPDDRYRIHVWLHGSADTALPALHRALGVLEQH